MLNTVFGYVIVGGFFIIGIVMLFFPDFERNVEVKIAEKERERYKNIPILNRISDFNLEVKKTRPTVAIRLLGFLIVFFSSTILLIMFTKI